jgi:translocation and assembly module TamB
MTPTSTTPSSRRRRLRLTLLVVAVLGLLLFAAVHWLLSSSLAREQVRGRMEAMLGVPVKVESVRIGLFSGSTFTRLQVDQRDAAAQAPPWLRVDRVEAGISAIGLLLGHAMPREMSLQGVSLELRFDPSGRLLTRLPRLKSGGGPMPALRLEAGRLTLAWEGRAPLVLRGIRGVLHDAPDGTCLEGTIDEPEWGQWTFGGDYRVAGGTFTLDLHNAGTHLTTDQVRRLPFVSPTVCDKVRAEGDTSVDCSLRYSTTKADVHYRVALKPENTRVRIASIDLDADGARGAVVVEDGKVSLRDMVGRTAGGEIATDADFDFTTPVYRLHFNPIRVRGARLKDLPPKWLPERVVRLGGVLTGAARLEVVIDKDGVRTSGEGRGTIDTTLADKPAKIGLDLHAEGKNFDFRPASPECRSSLRAALLRSSVAVEQPARDKPTLPTRSVNEMSRALGELGQVIAAGAKALLDGAKEVGKALDPAKPPTYLTASLKLDDVDIPKLMRQLGVTLPVPLTGRLSFDVQLDLPINATTDYKAYRFRGTARVNNADVAGLSLPEARARVRLDRGVLNLDELRGSVAPARKGDPAGGFSGTARVGVFPLGDLDAALSVEHLPLDVLLNRLPGTSNLAHGLLDGEAKLQVPVSRLSDPAAYTATATLRSDRLEGYGLALTRTTARLSLQRGIARVEEVRAAVEGAPLTADAEADLTAKGAPYTGKAEFQQADLRVLTRLAPAYRPPFTVEGTLGVTARLRGTLTPLMVTADGTAKATKVEIALVHLDEVTLAWAHDGDSLSLTDVDARLAGGRVTGKATLPFAAARTGKLELKAADLEAKDLAGALRPLPLRLDGRLSGTLTASLAAADKAGARETTLDAELTSGRLRIQTVPTQRVKATLRQVPGRLAYKVEGEVLGGKFVLQGQRSRLGADGPDGGRLRLAGARLSLLGAALDMPERLEPLRGRVDLELGYTQGADGKLSGTGRVSMTNVRWNGTEITDSLRGDLRLTGEDVQLRDFSGSIGDGVARGTAVVPLWRRGGWFRLTLERVEAERLLAPFAGATPFLTGPLDADLRGSLGDAWRGSGQVTLHRGQTFGVEVADWRLPVEFGFQPGSGEGYLSVRDSTAQLGHGRAQGHATLRWGEGVSLEGLLTFFNADLRTLLRSAGETATLPNGRLSGRLEFGAANLRSENDLVANFDAHLHQTQAFQLPVLSALTPYLAPGSGSTTFDHGSIRARLSNGVVRVQHLGLTGSLLRVLIEGTVNLQGRVDLDATASTGDLGNAVALQLLATRIPAVGPVPVGLIAQVSAFFANRVIHLRITGTLRNPVIRVDPVDLLTEEAVRYFVLGPFGLYGPVP